MRYKVYYYDSWLDSFEGNLSFDTLHDAVAFVEKEFLSSTDTDITAVYISWFECGVECEKHYILRDTGWEVA